jgi:hypothetical protein
MSWNTVLKLAAWAACLMVALQVIFCFILQALDYDSFWLSITLIGSALAFVALVILWQLLKKAG